MVFLKLKKNLIKKKKKKKKMENIWSNKGETILKSEIKLITITIMFNQPIMVAYHEK